MFSAALHEQLQQTLTDLREAGLYKEERIIASPQSNRIRLRDGRSVLNLCANNYLGLADHPEVIAAAHQALDDRGYGLASVRFICGTQDLHHQLERALAEFFGTDDAILYPSCFDANGGLFESLLGPEDAIISDQLNHASIIDGIRLCKAQRYRYANNDHRDLARQLEAANAAGARHKLIATDGVFSMDGIIAELPGLCDLAEEHGALVMIDDCHAAGFLGPTGRGTHEHHDVEDRVDIITGTLGKALGGASGGYTCGPRAVVELLRQRSRPYLFSNTVAPAIVAASLQVLTILQGSSARRDHLWENTRRWRTGLTDLGFTLAGNGHPITPVMLGDAALAQRVAARLLDLGVYVIGFFYPVVPQGQARIRTQISAAHTTEDLDFALAQFAEVKREFGL